VLVTHGGTEMGQGLHTKVCQVAAAALGVPVEAVHVAETATDKVANTSPTAASMSTDLYGMAALDACEQIMANLAPLREQLGPDATVAQLASAAHFARVDLTAHGFYRVPDSRCGYDWEVATDDDSLGARGTPFNYFTQGVALSEVEVDTLTGDVAVRRADICMDLGKSINPAIDIGQIEGAFVQGLGWSTTEELMWGDDEHKWIKPGWMHTRGPGNYKIPAFNDVPQVLNVRLLDEAENPFCVHSSKAVGEPPFFLGASVFFAVKDAVAASRKHNNVATDQGAYFGMDLPATSERVRMACCDEFQRAAVKGDAEGFKAKGSW